MRITAKQQADIEEARSRLLVYLNTEQKTYADAAGPCGVRPSAIRDFAIGTRKTEDMAKAICDNLPIGLRFDDWSITPF